MFNFQKIEKKWQKTWENKKNHQTKDTVKGKKNYMLLTEFPYPSGNLHIGHWYAFSIPDIIARYKKMRGFNIMYPIGFDAFGLPAENAAIKRKINPREWTEKNIKFMTKQLKSMGASFDWLRMVSTIDPKYYKWTQWIFLKMFKKGLAYRKKTSVNWCSGCKTVLANEQVVNGKCERCDNKTIQKEVEQWMFKIADYADQLVDDLEKLDWPESTKLAQVNWIDRSKGAIIQFGIADAEFKIDIFTTRSDTIFGATYLVLAPEHPLIKNLESKILNAKKVREYIEIARQKTDLERQENREKKGVELKGVKSVNPANNEKIPVWISDYVLMNYGTGAVMAVPAHDERDFEFAKKYKLPIRKVILSATLSAETGCFTGNGELVNSGQFTGIESEKAKKEIIEWLAKNGKAKIKINYRLRDWVLSRQRYWGTPIPMIKCEKCGYVPVEEKDLPIKLPLLKDFLPSDDGRSPLAKANNWVKTRCPCCKNWAERETDTMDTFVDSSWYFIRYTDPENKNKFADAKKMKNWLPVPMYVGGAEHNTMHLLYSRFFTKVLYDFGLIHFKEPFIGRRNHGIILGFDGQKMSKSRGNVVDPDDLVKKFGSDTVRMYLCFMGQYDQGGPWQSTGILGIQRFLQRIYKLATSGQEFSIDKTNDKLEKLLNQTVKKVAEDIENFRFNTAISSLMILFNEIENLSKSVGVKYFKTFLTLLAPFAPHLSEEIWQQLKIKKYSNKKENKNKDFFKSVHQEVWPKYDLKLIKEKNFELIIQINGKFKDKVSVKAGIDQKEAKEIVLKIEKIKKTLGSREIKKIIFVPDKLINIVI